MKCTRMVDDRRMNVTLNGKLLEEVEYIKYLGSYIAYGGEVDEVRHRMNEAGKVCGGLKKVFQM